MKQQIKVLFDTNVLFGHDNRLFIDNIATKIYVNVIGLPILLVNCIEQ